MNARMNERNKQDSGQRGRHTPSFLRLTYPFKAEPRNRFVALTVLVVIGLPPSGCEVTDVDLRLRPLLGIMLCLNLKNTRT